MAGLRERKKAQTRRRIAQTALRLFTERGFEAVTVNEIAEAAEVAKATLFAYFPSKESLALEGVAEEDLAGVVTARPVGQSPVAALRAHYRVFAENPLEEKERDALLTRMHVIFDSPVLSSAANTLLYRQRKALAEALTGEYGERAAPLLAAQIAGCLLEVQESFFHRLVAGASLQEAGHELAKDAEFAFDLLEHGSDQVRGG